MATTESGCLYRNAADVRRAVVERCDRSGFYPLPDKLYQVYIEDRRLGHFGFTKPDAKPTFDFSCRLK